MIGIGGSSLAFLVAGEGTEGSLPAGSDLRIPESLEAEGLLFASSIPRGLGPAQVRAEVGCSQAGLGTLAIGVEMGDPGYLLSRDVPLLPAS